MTSLPQIASDCRDFQCDQVNNPVVNFSQEPMASSLPCNQNMCMCIYIYTYIYIHVHALFLRFPGHHIEAGWETRRIPIILLVSKLRDVVYLVIHGTLLWPWQELITIRDVFQDVVPLQRRNEPPKNLGINLAETFRRPKETVKRNETGKRMQAKAPSNDKCRGARPENVSDHVGKRICGNFDQSSQFLVHCSAPCPEAAKRRLAMRLHSFPSPRQLPLTSLSSYPRKGRRHTQMIRSSTRILINQ